MSYPGLILRHVTNTAANAVRPGFAWAAMPESSARAVFEIASAIAWRPERAGETLRRVAAAVSAHNMAVNNDLDELMRSRVWAAQSAALKASLGKLTTRSARVASLAAAQTAVLRAAPFGDPTESRAAAAQIAALMARVAAPARLADAPGAVSDRDGGTVARPDAASVRRNIATTVDLLIRLAAWANHMRMTVDRGVDVFNAEVERYRKLAANVFLLASMLLAVLAVTHPVDLTVSISK